MNLSCYTKDLTKLDSNWYEEYRKENDTGIKSVYPISYNFEIAPSSDSKYNIVSRHCLTSKLNSDKIKTNKDFYSFDYFTHFNQ